MVYMSSKHNYDSLFPFPTIRAEQRQAIEFALDAFLDQRKKFVILEMGTGSGKSATGITIARYLAANQPIRLTPTDEASAGGAYVLTTQKVLQEQYINDFGPGKRNLLLSIKSSSNYACLHYTEQSCGESRRILSKMAKQLAGTDFFKCCTTQCPYKIDKQAFIDSPISITNFSYFLAETMYAKKLEPRQLLVIDECHNVESSFGKFIEVTFSEKFARDVLKCKVPPNNGQQTVFEWIKKTYQPKLTRYLAKLEKMLHSRFNSGMAGFGEYSKQYEMLDKHVCKVNRFINSYDPENWIMNLIPPPASRRGGRRFEFKPIDVAGYGHDMLYRFGDRVLMMSATVVDRDVFCRTVGVDPTDVAFLRIPSPFPIDNRRVHYMPAGSMSMSNIEQTLPIMVKAVKVLLDAHKDDKGIIHCGNYRIAQYLFNNVKSERLLIHNPENRETVLNSHITNDKPTVLLSPSMMEGIDLADDASRFQVLCKVPFPYLGDDVVRKRKAKDPSWYGFQTVKLVIQAMGRSVRNETDHATSYILDADWFAFYRRNSSLFPADFSQALSMP